MAQIDSLEIQISSNAATALSNLKQLSTQLSSISGQLGKINTSKLSSVGTSAKTATSGTKQLYSAVTKTSTGFKGLNTHSKSFASIAGSIYANCFLLIRGFKKLGSAIESSMDYIETYNYFNVTMDKIGEENKDLWEEYGYESAEAYADSFEDRMNSLTTKMTGYEIGDSGELIDTGDIGLGLDPEELMQYEAQISSITNSAGLLGETSVNAASSLTMLASDMSSLFNQDLSTTMQNLSSGLIGQSRALYKYGIDITTATLQQYAYDNGISKSVSEMTQAEKMQLRLIAILDQSKVAWGDQANTINSVANQYRIFKQQVSNVSRVIGNLFIPVVQKVLPVVNGLIIAIRQLLEELGSKIWGSSWQTDLMDGISSGVGDYDDSVLDELESDADDTTESLEDTATGSRRFKVESAGN